MNEKIKCYIPGKPVRVPLASACSPEKPAETASTSGELSGSINNFRRICPLPADDALGRRIPCAVIPVLPLISQRAAQVKV